MRVASIYLPNGNPIGTEKFAYKLAWMERLTRPCAICWSSRSRSSSPATTTSSRSRGTPHPEAWLSDALFQPESRASASCCISGLPRRPGLHDEPGPYTFWDYQAGAFQRDHGIRIDHLLLSPQAADRLLGAAVPKYTRSWEKPSDHVPVAVD